MDQLNQQISSPASPATRAAAFGVHVFTAMGAGIALIAMLEAVREHWAAMFAWLGLALVVDALDGPLARRLDVVRVQPNWSGEVLDLVVDFVTYVFVPAYAITASGLLLPLAVPASIRIGRCPGKVLLGWSAASISAWGVLVLDGRSSLPRSPPVPGRLKPPTATGSRAACH